MSMTLFAFVWLYAFGAITTCVASFAGFNEKNPASRAALLFFAALWPVAVPLCVLAAIYWEWLEGRSL